MFPHWHILLSNNEDCRQRKSAYGSGVGSCIFCSPEHGHLMSLSMLERSNEEELFMSA